MEAAYVKGIFLQQYMWPEEGAVLFVNPSQVGRRDRFFITIAISQSSLFQPLSSPCLYYFSRLLRPSYLQLNPYCVSHTSASSQKLSQIAPFLPQHSYCTHGITGLQRAANHLISIQYAYWNCMKCMQYSVSVSRTLATSCLY